MRARRRAAALAGPRRIELVEMERPRPGPGDAVRRAGCGVRGSDRAPWQGRERFRCTLPPGAPGHEGRRGVAAARPGILAEVR